MAYLLSNICTENYWNRTTVVKIIAGGWVVSFFETQCVSPCADKRSPAVAEPREALFRVKPCKLECGPMPNLMVALPNIGDALCSTPQSLADAHY